MRRRVGIVAAGIVAVGGIVAVVVVLATGGGGGGAAAATIHDVHGIGIDPDDESLFIATHTGLFRSAKGESSATRVDGPEQDLMGFSIAAPDRFLASGHPGPGQDLPPNLGLIESSDGGQSWRSVSLEGEADLHVLRAAGDTVYAFDGQLRRSTNGGRSWQELDPPGEIIDIAPNPDDPDHVLASTQDGLHVSANGGRTWRRGSLSVPALLAWVQEARVFAVDGEGNVSTSKDRGQSWQRRGAADGQPAAITADRGGGLYVAGPDGSVDQSSDSGKTWQPRSRN